MEPVYFGENESLFGLYHPGGAGYVSGAVLICAPLFNEYFRAYQIQHELAFELSNIGYDVLRFDYLGCGDSKKSMQDVTLADWLNNIVEARKELMELCGQDKVIVVAIRFAAALAFEALKSTPPKGIVLWDPILSGPKYLEQLAQIEREVELNYEHTYMKERPPRIEAELVGYEVHPGLSSEIASLVIESGSQHPLLDIPHRALRSNNSDHQIGLDMQCVDFHCEWTNSAGPLLFANLLVDQLANAVNEVNS